MNWTGGRLSRSTHNADSLSSRQKQHFAKVQSKLWDGTKKNSPHKWSILGNIIEDRQLPLSVDDRQEHSCARSQSMRQHGGRPYIARSISRSMEPQNILQKHIPEVTLECGSVVEDDLYGATPPPGKAKRRLESPMVRSQIQRPPEEEDLAAEKRRRLLLKGDWVGISIQRPVGLTFTYPLHGDDIGRRRKTTDGHRARYSSKQTAISSPFGTRKRAFFPNNIGTPRQERPFGRSDVRISIGGRVVPPGISSSTTPSRRHRNLDHSRISEYTQRASSDVMLLDGDEVVSRRNKESVWTMKKITDKQGEEQGPSSGYLEDSVDESQRELNRPRNVSGDFLEKRSTHSPLRAQYSKQVPQRSKLIESPILGVFTSSSATVHHPKPRSSKVSVLLYSGTSDNADSTFAHVGKNKLAVPSSQVLDNEIWETWMAPIDDKGEGKIAEGSSSQRDSLLRISVSPGMSAAPPIFHSSQPTAVSSSTRSSARKTADVFNDYNDSYRGESSPQPLPDEHSVEESNEMPLEPSSKMATEEALLEPIIGAQKYNLVGSKALQKLVVKESDTDDAWRKFVFGSSSDNDEAMDDMEGHKKLDLPSTTCGFLSSSMIVSTSTGDPTDFENDSSIIASIPVQSKHHDRPRHAFYEQNSQLNSTSSQSSTFHNSAVLPKFSSTQLEQDSIHEAKSSPPSV